MRRVLVGHREETIMIPAETLLMYRDEADDDTDADRRIRRLVEEVQRLYQWRASYRNAYTTVAEKAQAYVDDRNDVRGDDDSYEALVEALVEALADLRRCLDACDVINEATR
jgi:hypothetical protein